MSFCRFSSDDGNCDLYAYEHVDDSFRLLVAGVRFTIPASEIDFENDETFDKYLKPIGLKYDGKEFVYETLQELYDAFIMLRDEGYNFPDDVLEDILLEIKEDNY